MREESGDDIIVIEIPFKLRRRGGRKQVVVPDNTPSAPTQLQFALARAFHWRKMLDEGEVESLQELAVTLGIEESKVARQLRMTLLAPDIVEAILEGKKPSGLSMTQLLGSIPAMWEEQWRLFSFTEE